MPYAQNQNNIIDAVADMLVFAHHGGMSIPGFGAGSINAAGVVMMAGRIY